MKNTHLIYELYARHEISEERFVSLQNSLQKEKLSSIYYTFFGLGLTLLITGLLFFVAANWQSIPDFIKLYTLQILFISCVIVAFIYRDKNFFFASFILIASILIGLNLAVFGQVYQTGADAYTLFATWTVLITLWAWTLKLPYVFMLWYFLLYVSIAFFIEQYVQPFLGVREDDIRLFAALFSNALLALSLFYKKLTIFNKPNRIILLGSALFFTAVAMYGKVFMHKHLNFNHLIFAIFVIQTALLAWYFHKNKRLFPISLVLLNIVIFIESLLMHTIFSGRLFSLAASSFFLFSFLSFLLLMGLFMLIKKLHIQYKGIVS